MTMPRFAIGFTLVSLGLLALGCSSKAERLTASERQRVDELVTKQAPRPQHPLDIKFGDKVTLLGYDLSGNQLGPDKDVTVTWYYRVDKAPGEGWQLFTHLADARDVSRVNFDRTGALRKLFQPEHWEAGTFVTDPQTLALPRDWDSPKLVVYMGFWKKGTRLPVQGPSDGNSRARVLELNVELTGHEPELPELVATQAKTAIELDGKLGEAAWTEAARTDALVNTMTGAAAEPKVTVKSAWDDKNLYVAFDVADDFLKSTFDKNDDHLWNQDCVEVMVDPDGDGRNYFELQVSPANKAFDTRYDTRRKPAPFGHTDWNSGLKSAVDLRGTLNAAGEDEGYTAEIAIPWTAFSAGDRGHGVPKPGDSWRINFYVMDARSEGMRAVGWSPPRVSDFHMPKRFGKLTFAGMANAAPETNDKPAPDEQARADNEAKATASTKEPAKAAETRSAAASKESVVEAKPD